MKLDKQTLKLGYYCKGGNCDHVSKPQQSEFKEGKPHKCICGRMCLWEEQSELPDLVDDKLCGSHQIKIRKILNQLGKPDKKYGGVFVRTQIVQALATFVEEEVIEELKNRLLTIKWLWNKEKTDTDKLLMVQKQLLMYSTLTLNRRREKNEET